MRTHFNALSKELKQLGRRHGLAKVFNDLLQMGICSFHRTNIQSRMQEQDPKNETLYLDTIKGYDKEELQGFAKSLGTLQLQVYEAPYSDILGEFYTLEITKGHNGAYFTPEPVSDLMAKLQSSSTVEHQTVLDPACGSARMLLRFAKENPNNQFFGADNNSTCAKMATLNCFLNGLKAEISAMNSLSMEWYSGYHINTQGLGIVPIEREQSLIWHAPPTKSDIEIKPMGSQGQQLDLF